MSKKKYGVGDGHRRNTTARWILGLLIVSFIAFPLSCWQIGVPCAVMVVSLSILIGADYIGETIQDHTIKLNELSKKQENKEEE